MFVPLMRPEALIIPLIILPVNIHVVEQLLRRVLSEDRADVGVLARGVAELVEGAVAVVGLSVGGVSAMRETETCALKRIREFPRLAKSDIFGRSRESDAPRDREASTSYSGQLPHAAQKQVNEAASMEEREERGRTWRVRVPELSRKEVTSRYVRAARLSRRNNPSSAPKCHTRRGEADAHQDPETTEVSHSRN